MCGQPDLVEQVKSNRLNRSEIFLRERRIAHAKARANVLGNEFNRGAVRYRIALSQVLHSLHQQALAVDVARIGRTLSFSGTSQRGRDRNCKNFSHG